MNDLVLPVSGGGEGTDAACGAEYDVMARHRSARTPRIIDRGPADDRQDSRALVPAERTLADIRRLGKVVSDEAIVRSGCTPATAYSNLTICQRRRSRCVEVRGAS